MSTRTMADSAGYGQLNSNVIYGQPARSSGSSLFSIVGLLGLAVFIGMALGLGLGIGSAGILSSKGLINATRRV